MEMIFDSIKQTLMITSFVMVMMLLIEYFNVRTGGRWTRGLQGHNMKQILFAMVIAVIPGCLGTFAIVSLYTHGILTFGALLAALVATTGDEAFVMLSVIPGAAVKIMLILLALGFATGFLTDLIFKNPRYTGVTEGHYQFHHEDEGKDIWEAHRVVDVWKNISFERAFLLFGLLMFIFGMATGFFHHDDLHEAAIVNAPNEWGFMWVTFIAGATIATFVVGTVPDHFLEHHLWEHIIKKHFPRIFLWTLGALLIISYALHSVNIESWLRTNHLMVLFIALLVGLIPISGPHLIFTTLFASGTIPFSVLLVNSLVQDGHGALPLFAESKKSFAYAKLIKVAMGLLIGLAGYFIGF